MENIVTSNAERILLKRKQRQRKGSDQSSFKIQVQQFNDLLNRRDDLVCTSCQQTFYQLSVYTVIRKSSIRKGLSPKYMEKVLTD
jgi:hypothetical protein